MARVPIERHGRPRPCELYSKGPSSAGQDERQRPFDGTRATGVATDENTNERAPNQKTSGRNGLCPEETTKISILSGKNRFIPDEILIEGKKIKTTGALLTGGRSAAVPRERIAQHQSERALTADGIYDTLSPNQKNVRQNRPLTGGNHQNQHFVRLKSFYPG